jgi:flagellar biosynthesis/type III secretory pathway chaperone
MKLQFRELHGIIDQRHETAQDLIRYSLSNIVSDEFLKFPKDMLDSIHKRLELLRTVGWDIDRLTRRHLELVKELDSIANQLKQLPKYQHLSDPYAFADSMTESLKLLIYSFVDIGYLMEEVNCLCRNYVITIEKIA